MLAILRKMKITVLAVGKSHDALYVAAINDFQERLQRYCSFAWEHVPSSSKEEESAALLKRSRGYVILLDETGELYTTPQLAAKLERLQNQATKELTILIGGAFGVTDEVKAAADFVWSLSPLVFPHQLVRLLLVEQLYRAYDILQNGKYHHA